MSDNITFTVPQDQNSTEWLAWRKKGIGASDIPIIVGQSKWCTPYQLWQRKLGFISEAKENFSMRRGKDLEGMVRDLVNMETKLYFEPRCLVHKELPWAFASLDGLNEQSRVVLEIKCPGEEDHATAKSKKIPLHYYPQVQWQLFVSDMPKAYYASYNKNLALVEVERNDEYIAEELLPAASEFYRCMKEFEEPPRSEDDYMLIEDPKWEEYAREWKQAAEMAQVYKEKEKYFKNKLISLTDDSNCKGAGVALRRVSRIGTVDWIARWHDLCNKVDTADTEFPIDHYRKEQIGYWKVFECSE